MRISYPQDYHLDHGIWIPNGDSRDLPYSEGEELEVQLARLVAEARDLSVLSPELRRLIHHPRTRYHLSPRRANLLRPFAAALTSRVLEVGAGCGAITRYLGELGGRVTAVEGSRRRAAIARARTRDLPNVEVVWDDATRLSTAERFDVVVLVGVLEYARVFLRAGMDSQRQLLAHLGGLLHEDGMLILAIENQLGARYWAGGAEDHLLAEFFGIQDNYTESSVATFGRHSLREILIEAGFPQQQWYVPVPDYKLPSAVLSPAGLGLTDRFDAAAVLAQNVFGDERKAVRPRFSLERVWSVLQRNHLLLEFANSFLVVAGRSDAVLDRLQHDRRLGWSYAVDRWPGYATEACVSLEEDGLMIRRRRLAPEASALQTPLVWRLHDEPYAEGRNWWCELVALLTRPGWTTEDLARWARTWLDALLRAAGLDPAPQTPHDGRLTVGGWLLNATPNNLVATRDGAYRFFDLEWQVRDGVELGFLVYRALSGSLGQLTSVTWTGSGPLPTPAGLLQSVFAELGLTLEAGDLDRYRRLEAQFQGWSLGDF